MPEAFTNDGAGTVPAGAGAGSGGPFTDTWMVSITRAFPTAATGTQFHVADTAQGAFTEKILVTSGSGAVGTQTWTVTRGAEGTTPVAHLPGFTVVQVVTAGVLSGFAPSFCAPSGDTTGAADAAAFQAAASAGNILELQAGGIYYVNTPTVFPPGTGLVCKGQSLQYYGGSLAMPLTGAVIQVVAGFTGSTVNGQAVEAPVVMVSKDLGGYSTGSAGQTFRGITITGHGTAPAGVNGIEAWGPVWGVTLERVGVYGVTGNGVQTNKTLFPSGGDTTHFPDLWQVVGCHFGGNGGHGFSGASISDSYFLASEATGNQGNGWAVNGDNFSFVQCKAEFNTIGWALSASGAHQRAVRLTSCGTDSNTQHGIQIAGASQWPVILTNIGLTNDGSSDGVSGTSYAGLNVTGGAHVSVSGMHILTEANTPANGILCTGAGSYVVTLSNCEIYARAAPISNTGSGQVITGANVITGTGNWQAGTVTSAYQPLVSPGGALADSGSMALYARYSVVTGQAPRETVPWYAAEGNLTLTSTTLYLAVLPVLPGDVISNLGFATGPSAFTGVSNWWTALYTLGAATFLRQSANQTGALAGSHAYPLALSSSYTVPAGTYQLLAGVMINASGMQPLRGASLSAAQTDAATSLFPGAQQMAAAVTTAGGASAPAGPLTLTATGVLVYMGAN